MKKSVALLIILCLILTAAGCGNAKPAAPEPIASAGNTVPAEETAEVPETTHHAPLSTPLPTFEKTTTIEPTVLYQENNVTITATQLRCQNYSVDVELLIENNSSEPLTFICESLGYSCNSVNGHMIEDGYLNCTVDPSKKANDSIRFRIQNLMLHGIYEVAELEIGFDIRDEDLGHIYTGPIQLKTSAFEGYEGRAHHYLETVTNPGFMDEMEFQVPYTSREMLYDDNGIRLLSSCLLRNEDGERMLVLEVENDTEEMLHLQTFDIAFNGLNVHPSRHTALSMNPGKRGLLVLTVDSALEPQLREAYGIREIDSIGFRLLISDWEWENSEESQEIRISFGKTDSGFDASGTEVYNQDGLRIINKGIVKESSAYNKNQHLLLLVVNDSDQTVKIDDVYDSLSVNGFMINYYFYGQDLLPGESGALRIELPDSALEHSGIAEISEAEIRLTLNHSEEITLKMAY